MSIFNIAVHTMSAAFEPSTPCSKDEQLLMKQKRFAEAVKLHCNERRDAAAKLRVQQARNIGQHFSEMLNIVMTEITEVSGVSAQDMRTEMGRFEKTLMELATIRLGDIHFGPMLDLVEIVILDLTGDLATFGYSFDLTRDLMSRYIKPIVLAKDNPEQLLVLSNIEPGSLSSAELKPHYTRVLYKLKNGVYFDDKITTERVDEMREEVRTTGSVNLGEAAQEVSQTQSGNTKH